MYQYVYIEIWRFCYLLTSIFKFKEKKSLRKVKLYKNAKVIRCSSQFSSRKSLDHILMEKVTMFSENLHSIMSYTYFPLLFSFL